MGDEISGELNIIANPKKAGLVEVMSIEEDRFSLCLKEFMTLGEVIQHGSVLLDGRFEGSQAKSRPKEFPQGTWEVDRFIFEGRVGIIERFFGSDSSLGLFKFSLSERNFYRLNEYTGTAA